MILFDATLSHQTNRVFYICKITNQWFYFVITEPVPDDNTPIIMAEATLLTESCSVLTAAVIAFVTGCSNISFAIGPTSLDIPSLLTEVISPV